MKKLLFTDLDGTLLDLHTYAAEKAKESVAKLQGAGVSIIFCSSKTWAEQEHYLHELDLNEPAIVENGSAIFFPEDLKLKSPLQPALIHGKKALLLGRKYEEVVRAIYDSTADLDIALKYYNNQSVARIAEITGLSLNAAQKAKSRDFSETIFNALPDTDAFKSFEKALKNHGFQCIAGSKYVTITGIDSNKGKAVSLLIEAYQAKFGEVKSIGIGDSRNDLEMLQCVDSPYLVKKPDNTWANLFAKNISKIAAIGPDGWNIMAEELLAD